MHKDVEFHIDRWHREHGSTIVAHSYTDACQLAVTECIAHGVTVKLDVVVWSEAGAKAYGGDDAASQYRNNPHDSVFERFEVKVNNVGRIP
jgi:hypothetical protein